VAAQRLLDAIEPVVADEILVVRVACRLRLLRHRWSIPGGLVRIELRRCAAAVAAGLDAPRE
jgi:hypothetical protein